MGGFTAILGVFLPEPSMSVAMLTGEELTTMMIKMICRGFFIVLMFNLGDSFCWSTIRELVGGGVWGEEVELSIVVICPYDYECLTLPWCKVWNSYFKGQE